MTPHILNKTDTLVIPRTYEVTRAKKRTNLIANNVFCDTRNSKRDRPE